MSRTGHRSTAVRSYKRPSSTLVKAVADSLQPPTPKEGKEKKLENDEEEKKENDEEGKQTASSSSFSVNIKHGKTSISFYFH